MASGGGNSALAAKRAPSCPLPVGQQVKAVKAFREMTPVFRHPRCLNCHGGLDLFSEQHPGAGQLDESLDPNEPMAPDTRAGPFAEQCADCHDNIRRLDHPSGKGGWTTPPPPMFFVDGAPPADCGAIGSQRERWVVYAYVDSTSGAVNTWRSLFQEDPLGGISCRAEGGSQKWDLQPGSSLSMLAFGRLNIPPDSGSSKTETEEDGGQRESLTIPVLEVPAGE